MHGHVKSYDPAKRYGFIRGQDAHDYFFHIDDVSSGLTPVLDQIVTFEPRAARRGPRAEKVVLGARPERVLVNPDEFLVTRRDAVPGHLTVEVRHQGLHAESNDPNEAKRQLVVLAKKWSANAIVNLRLEKYSKQDGPCSNYHYTMHRFYGDAVVVKKPTYSTDPDLIDRSRPWPAPDQGGYYPPTHCTALVRPALWIFIPSLTWCLTKTALTICWLFALSASVRVCPALRHLPFPLLKVIPALRWQLAQPELAQP